VSPIDLLLIDVVVPGMNGRELADPARALLPNIKVLFMTGYSENAFADEGRIDPDVEVIELRPT
jgi:CheY-like chemotaxis protein